MRVVRGIEVNEETLSLYQAIEDTVNGEGHFLRNSKHSL